MAKLNQRIERRKIKEISRTYDKQNESNIRGTFRKIKQNLLLVKYQNFVRV